MFRSMDLRSALIGGLVVAMVIGVMGAVTEVRQDRHGRFSLAVADSGQAYVLDTATGEVWSTSADWFGFYAPKTFDDPNRVPSPAPVPRR